MIGTLKQAEGRLAVSAVPGRDWTKRIELACRQYNATVHSATGLAPNEVNPSNANQVFRRLFPPLAKVWKERLKNILPLGTWVRLRIFRRGAFVKTNVARNSEQVFVVGRIRLHPRAVVKYKLFTGEDKANRVPIAGTYDRSELVPITLPQRT